MQEVKAYKKYTRLFLGVTFGICWGTVFLYIFFEKQMFSIFGDLTLTNPLRIIALYSPSVMAFLIYYLEGGIEGLKNFAKNTIPRKKDLKWFPIIMITMVIYIVLIRAFCILLHFDVPDMTYTPKERFIAFLKQFYEEQGMLGGAWGWFGFLYVYNQGKYGKKIKAAVLTGVAMGLFTMPAYLTSPETTTCFPFYFVQVICLCICLSYILNDTNGNPLMYIAGFWVLCSASRMQLYYFAYKVQVIQIILFLVLWAILHFYFKKTGRLDQNNQVLAFPNYVKSR